MRRIGWFYGAFAALGMGGVACAADLPAYEPAPAVVSMKAFSWNGGYVGVQGGYDWFRADNKVNGASVDTRPDGFTVGAFAGFNYQLQGSPVVVGVEADANYADAKDRRGTAAFGAPTTLRADLDWNGSVRGRLGYAFDRFLVYGAGGLALADRDVRARGAVNGSDDKLAVGWTVGGGVEAALSDNVTARVEYRYSDFGTDSFSVAGSRVKSDVTDNRVLLGVGYKFSSDW